MKVNQPKGESIGGSTWRRGQLLAKVLVGGGLLGIMLSVVDVKELWSVFRAVNPWYLAAAIIIFYIDRFVLAYKWLLLLVALGVPIRLSILFRSYVMAPAIGLVVPATIGQDIFRYFAISQDKARTLEVIASMMVDRVIALVVTVVVALCALIVTIYRFQNQLASLLEISAYVVPLVTVGVMALAGVCVYKGYSDRLTSRWTPYSIVGKLRELVRLCCEYRKYQSTLVIVAIWTGVAQMTPIVSNVLLAVAIDLNVSLLALITITPLVSLVNKLPISYDGLGVQEGAYMALLGLMGVAPSEAFALSMMTRIVTVVAAVHLLVHWLMGGNPTLGGQTKVNIW